MKKHRFLLVWSECHNPLNWGDTEEQGLKELRESLPAKKVYVNPSGDGWADCECELEADTLEEAKELAKSQMGAEIFSIIDLKTHETVFTEEDLE